MPVLASCREQPLLLRLQNTHLPCSLTPHMNAEAVRIEYPPRHHKESMRLLNMHPVLLTKRTSHGLRCREKCALQHHEAGGGLLTHLLGLLDKILNCILGCRIASRAVGAWGLVRCPSRLQRQARLCYRRH